MPNPVNCHMNKMRIYISGRITSLPYPIAVKRFAVAARRLADLGHEPVNPIYDGLPSDATWAEHMRADLAILETCDGICMLRGWERSRGAQIERRAALKRGIPIYTFSEDRRLIPLTDTSHHEPNKNPAHMEPTETKTKRCTHCGAVKPMSDFYQNRNTRDGLASWCKTCQKAAVRAHREAKRAACPPFEGDPAACSFARVMPARHPDAPPLNLDLAPFTARQLMRELYARGYEGELRITQRVNIATCKR